MYYDRIIIFTKRGNMSEYFQTARVSGRYNKTLYDDAKARHDAEREIQLIACVRYEDYPVSTPKGIIQMSKVFCRIKCPVNPLPVKGEFELPSLESLYSFLKANGWTVRQAFDTRLFE